MSITQLHYFLAVADCGSTTSAAERLFVSQSTLSKAISALEKEYQVSLFNRTNQGLVLSEQGLIFYEIASDLVQYWNMKETELENSLHHAKPSLSIGIPPTAGAIFFFKVFGHFSSHYPDISLHIEETTSKQIIQDVLDHKLDLGVIIEPHSQAGLHKIPVLNSQAVLLCSHAHPFASKNQVRMIELKNEPFLIISNSYLFHDKIIEHCRSAGFEPNIVFESFQWEWLFEMVADNQGVTILPLPLIEKFINEKVCAIPLIEPAFPWTLSLIYRVNESLSNEAKAFLRLAENLS